MSAEYNKQVFNAYEGDWNAWRRRAVKLDNFYNGKQYDRTVASQLRSQGLKPIAINVVRPLIAQQIAILTSTKPSWRVVPLKHASKEVAEISQRFMVGKWNSDYVDTQLWLALQDMCKVGMGFLFIDVANFIDNATFDIIIERIPWKFVYPDPNCLRFDGSDAENFVIKKDVGLKRAQVVFGLTERQVKDAIHYATTSGVATLNAEVIDRFSKYPVDRFEYNIRDLDKNYIREKDLPPTVFYTSNLKNKVEAEKKKWLKDLRELESEGVVELKNLRETNIYRCISVGSHEVYEGIMNIRDYPVIMFADEHNSELVNVYGEAAPLEGIQEATNKFYMLTLQNAMLSGNTSWSAPLGAIKDKAKWQKTANLPGGVKEWEPQADLPNYGKPERDLPAPLASAFYNLSQDLMQKAEYQTGIYAPAMGNPKGTPDTFSTTTSLQEFGTQRIKALARRVEVMIAKAGEVMMQYIQNYTDVSELLEYVDDSQYTPDGQPNPQYGQMISAGTLNQPDVKEGLIKEIKNNSRIGHYAVKILTQPNFGSDRLNKASFISNMVMNKALPMTPAVANKLFDLLELPGYQEIVTEMQQRTPNIQTIKQLIQNIKMLQKQNQMLMKESEKMAKQLEISDFRRHLDKELLNIKEAAAESTSKSAEEIRDEVTRLMQEMETQKNGEGQQGNNNQEPNS